MRFRRRRFGRFVFFIIVTILLTTSLWIIIDKLFRIQRVEIRGAQIGVVIDQEKINKNLLFFPVQKVREQLRNQNPLLKDIVIRKKFPNTLEITAHTRDPVARVSLDNREIVVDSAGITLGISQQEHQKLPVIIGVTENSESLQKSVIIIAGLSDIYSVTNINGSSLLAKTSTTDIYFPQKHDLNDKVATLQTLLSGFRIKGTLPKMIDLRFEKPIVTF